MISGMDPRSGAPLRQPGLPRLRRRRGGARDRRLDHHRPCGQCRALLPGFHRGRRDGVPHHREGPPLHHRQWRCRAPARRGRGLRRVRPGRWLPARGGLCQQRRGQPGERRARRWPRRRRPSIPAAITMASSWPSTPAPRWPWRRARRWSRSRAGGGGYAAPSAREPERVAHDVREKWVSPEAAREVYRVALDRAGNVDEAETRRLRTAAELGARVQTAAE